MVEAIRTFWKGHLRLALVTIPVRLVTAEKPEATPKFHQIDRETKQRIRYVKMAPGRGEVKKEDIVMGYEVEPGNYVLMEDGELDAVKLETRHTIELTQFVDQHEIDPLYFERPYYMLPDGDIAEEGYAVIRDALRASGKAAIGQLTLRGKENLVAIYPGGAGLVVDTMRYEEEIKDADDVFSGLGKAKTRPDMVKMAEELIASRTEPFEPSRYKNHYADALRELVKSKMSKGEAVSVEQADKPAAKVLDFMEALKRSVSNAGAAQAEPEKTKKTPSKPTKGKSKRSA
ncbi:MAG: Ku protein [Hyphomicrobiales bacterium]|nr:Ku protein [Hyphomicrobiales bacterium]